MRAHGKSQEKRCENCTKSDEQAILARKQLNRQKADNDVLVSQLKQLGDESKRVIENLVVPRLQPTQAKVEIQEDSSKKQVETAKKQLGQTEKRLKLLSKREETPLRQQDQSQAEEIRKLTEELEKAKAKNQELKKEQREQEKDIKLAKATTFVNQTQIDIKSLKEKLRTEQASLQKKEENKEKLIKRMDEIEARHKEVCTKCGVTPLVRPNFKEEGGESARQAIPKKEMAKSKSDGSILKKEQNSAPKPETITMETILSAQENLNSIKKSIKSYTKSHELRMINLVQKEDTDSTKNKDLQTELDLIIQECAKAQQAIKELQNVPRDSVLEGASAKFLTEVPSSHQQTEPQTPGSLPVDTKTLMFNKNKFKRELNGSKFITDHSVLWADYNTLPGERSYRMLSLKFYHNKENEVLRIEIEYLLSTGETELTAQPPSSSDVPNEKDIKCIDIKFARNEYLQEISGTNDATRITSLKMRTSMYKEYSFGQLKFGLKNKEFKFNILPNEKPVSLFGCFDVTKSGRLALAQLGVEISKKDLVSNDQQRKDPWASKSILVKSMDKTLRSPTKDAAAV